MNQDLKDLKYAIEEISSVDILDSYAAKIKQEHLRKAIQPVMRDFLQKALEFDREVASSLIKGINLENELVKKTQSLRKIRISCIMCWRGCFDPQGWRQCIV